MSNDKNSISDELADDITFRNNPDVLRAQVLDRDCRIETLYVLLAEKSGKIISLTEQINVLTKELASQNALLLTYKQALVEHIHKLLK